MNYTVITNETILKDFIEWLPVLQQNEIYYVCLFARNKYCKDIKHISSDKAQLKRFTSNKESLFNKIKQLEVEIGCYKQKNIEVPQEALACYITVNPRDTFKAAYMASNKLSKLIFERAVNFNPHQEVMSELQKSKSRSVWVDFDIDNKEPTFEELNKIVPQAYKILETRGGYHVLVSPFIANQGYDGNSEPRNKNWYNQISKLYKVDQVGDNMIPIPGTYQGGFTPHFIN